MSIFERLFGRKPPPPYQQARAAFYRGLDQRKINLNAELTVTFHTIRDLEGWPAHLDLRHFEQEARKLALPLDRVRDLGRLMEEVDAQHETTATLPGYRFLHPKGR